MLTKGLSRISHCWIFRFSVELGKTKHSQIASIWSPMEARTSTWLPQYDAQGWYVLQTHKSYRWIPPWNLYISVQTFRPHPTTLNATFLRETELKASVTVHFLHSLKKTKFPKRLPWLKKKAKCPQNVYRLLYFEPNAAQLPSKDAEVS